MPIPTPILSKGPVFTFDPTSHQYFLDGVEIPGVTTILKTAGLCREYGGFDEAAWRGLHVHQCCELLDLNDLDWRSVYPRWVSYVKAYARFKDDTSFTPELIELQRYHPALRFAGTLDRIGLLGHERVLLDLKTGQQEAWHPFQTAGYLLLNQEEGLSYRRGAVYLREDGGYHLVWHEEAADMRVFLAALTITHAKWAINGGSRP